MRRLLARLSFVAACSTAVLSAADRAIDLRSSIPKPGSTEVCPDTSLRLAFSTAPTLGTDGRIRIHDGATQAVIETIDLASPTAKRTIGGQPYDYYPVRLAGREVVIAPATTLAYGHAYYVTIDAGVFRDDAGAFAAIADPNLWRFTTKRAPPRADADHLLVDPDGSRDFCTVQGAIAFVPEGNTRRVVIELRAGTYHEMVNVPRGKDAITLRGEDRQRSEISYANNARFNSRVRSVVDVYASDFVLENLTIRNTTPRGGSQAEALRVRADRTRITRCDFFSLQDTLQLTGRVHVSDCLVEGDVDFVWGSGTVVFDRCELKALNPGYLVQSRNGADRLGYIFLDCRLTAAPGVARYILARIEPSRFPHSHVAFIDCAMGPHVTPVAWQFDAVPGANPPLGPTDKIQFQEFHSTDLAGKPLDVSGRHPASRQLTPAEAARLRDLRNDFGEWNPPP